MAEMVIFFCDQCGLRIPQKDFITGKARKSEETKALCAQCASGGEAAPDDGAKSHQPLRDSKPGVRPAGRQTPVQGGERKSGPAVRDSKLGITPATREAGAVARAGKAHLAAPAAPPSTSRNLIFAGVGVVAVFGVLLAVLLSGKPGAAPREKTRQAASESPSVPRPPAPSTAPSAGTEASPRESVKESARTPESETYDPRAAVAASLLLQAKQYLASRPDDPWGYREKLEQLKTGYARTPAGDEAARLLADLKLPEKPAAPAEGTPGSAEAFVVDRLDYADDQAAQAAWHSLGNGAPVAMAEVEGRRAVRFACRFKGTKGDRAYWDHSLPLDLTGARGLQFQFYCRDTRPISGFTAYLKSGNGWYNWYRKLTEPGRAGWTTFRLDKSEAGSEGAPAGWGRIEAMRLSAWRGADEDTEFCVSELARLGGGAPAAAAAPVTVAAPVATAAPVEPEQAAQAEYARFLTGLQALLSQKAWPLARARLEEAAKDPKLAACAEALKLDGECLALLEKAQQAVAKGAAALTDGRAFVLEQTDGKRLAVGQGSKNSVRKAEGDALQIEQDIGGGKLTMNLPLSKLKAETRQELARLGLPADGEGKLALALMQFPPSRGKDAAQAEKDLRSLLAQAEKEGAPAANVARVRAWLDAAQREEAAARAFQEVEGLIEAKQGEAAAAAFKGFRKEYAGTAFGREVTGRFEEIEAALKKLLTKYYAGLLGEYYHAREADAGQLKFRRVDAKIDFMWWDGPSPELKDFRFVRWAGELNVPADGRYEFMVKTNDHARLAVGGRVIFDEAAGSAKNAPVTAELKAGWTPLALECGSGGHTEIHLLWSGPGFAQRPAGGDDLRVPASLVPEGTAGATPLKP